MSLSDEEEDKWLKEMEAEEDDHALRLLKTWILPRTQGFFRAPSGHRLHVRAVLPPAGKDIKATVLFCHGLNAHVNNRVGAEGFYTRIASEGFALFAIDIVGHGYSEGTRALVEDWHRVFTDQESFLEMLMGVSDPKPNADTFDADISEYALARVRCLPIFVLGASMGGMIGMYMGLRLQRHERLCDNFRGVVMSAPALAVSLPSKTIRHLLRNLVVPCFKTWQMPTAFSSSSRVKTSWSVNLSDPEQKKMAEITFRDNALRFPGTGLGWREGMLWGTANAFSELYDQIDKDMQDVRYPFLVLHDPGDKVSFASGSKRLMELSKSDDKTFEAVDAGGLHFLPHASRDLYFSRTVSWMCQHL